MLLAMLSATSCMPSGAPQQKNTEGEYHSFELNAVSEITLQKKFKKYTTITYAGFLYDSLILLRPSQDDSLFIFNKRGNLISSIAMSSLCIDATNAVVRALSGSSYVLCPASKKLISFSTNGDTLSSTIVALSGKPKNFTLDHRFIYIYNDQSSDRLLSVYDRSNAIWLAPLLPVSIEHKVLSRAKPSGGFAEDEHYVYATYTDRPTVFKINKSDLSLDSLPIVDARFTAGPIKGKDKSRISDYNFIQKYLSENSIVTGLVAFDQKIMVFTETGSYKVKAFSGEINFNNRYETIYMISDATRLALKITKLSEPTQAAGFTYYLADQRQLYSLSPAEDEMPYWYFVLTNYSFN